MAKLFPDTMMEFERWFQSEEACREYLLRLRWPEGFRCRVCRDAPGWGTRRGVFRCAICRQDASATAGTMFHQSHLSLRLWFRAIWLATNQKTGISALGLQRALGMGSYRTAWLCLQKIRRAMVRPGREMLSGEVEVDEVFVGGRERGGGRRRLGNKALIVVAAECRGEATGRIRIEQIPEASRERLHGFVRRVAESGSMIVTDGLMAYRELEQHGYPHRALVPDHRRDASRLLPRVHRTASLLKRWLLGTHQGRVGKRQLPHYLDEFVFRFNRRLSPTRGQLFYRMVENAVKVQSTPYRSVVGSIKSPLVVKGA